MGDVALHRMVAPNFRTPRLLGIFSVVFAAEILIFGLCMGGYLAVVPLFTRLMHSSRLQIEAQAERAKKAELDTLAEREKAARTVEEKAEIAAQRTQIRERTVSPVFGAMDVNRVQMADPAILRYSWLDVVSGIVLNVMLLASGIGLLHWRPWARSLGVWTAGLKLVRLVLVYGYFIIVIVPTYSERLGKAVSQMMGANTPGVFMTEKYFIRLYTVMYTGMGLGVMIVGAVYPALLLWFLTRPGVKSACSGLLRTPKEPNQPC